MPSSDLKMLGEWQKGQLAHTKTHTTYVKGSLPEEVEEIREGTRVQNVLLQK